MNNTNSEEISKNTIKSQTSLVGIKCKDGVVMAGDRRATLGGQIVARKNEQKVHKINEYLTISYTGNVSDAQISAKVIAAELKLKELKTRERPTVKESANLLGNMFYKNMRTPSMIPAIVGLLVGGFNEDGSTELYTISPDGVVWPVDSYDANLSSGMPYILGLMEGKYSKEITVKEGIELAKEAIKAAMERDTASGNGIDVFTIKKSEIQHVISEEITPQFNKD